MKLTDSDKSLIARFEASGRVVYVGRQGGKIVASINGARRIPFESAKAAMSETLKADLERIDKAARNAAIQGNSIFLD